MTDQIEIPDAFPASGEVDGKRVVMTGAGPGLGALLAHAFSAAGARVVLVARTETDLKAVAGALPGPTLVLGGDVTDEEFNESVADAAVAEWGGVDVWICNAGISPVVAGPRETDAGGLAAGARREPDRCLPRRPRRRPGHGRGRAAHLHRIGARASARARGSTAYSASKAGLVGLAKGLALDLAPAGITVNVVAPGWFDSPLAEGWKSQPKLADAIIGHTAQGRWGAPTDLAGAYQFLASDAAAFVTGTVLTVDGGYLLV